MTLFNQLQSMLVFVLLVHSISYFGLADQKYVPYLRILYLFSQMLQLFVAFIIFRIIAKKAEKKSKVVVTEPPKPFTNEPASTKEMTIEEYDKMKIMELIKQNIFNCAFVLFLHLKFGYIQILIIQALMTLKAFILTPIVKIHLFNVEPIGDLARPFPQPKSPLAALFQPDSDQEEESNSKKTQVLEAEDSTSADSKPKDTPGKNNIELRSRKSQSQSQ